MKKFFAILLLLAGCSGSDEAEELNEAGGEALPLDLANAAAPADPAALQAKVEGAMAAVLANAKDAQYRNLRAGAGGSACGEVAEKGKDVFRPFVVTPEGVAVVAAGPKIAYEDPNDFLADAWIRWCASPAELEALGPALQAAAAKAAAAGPDPVNVVGMDIPLPEPQAPPADPPKPKAPPPPPPQIDSFFNSVQR